MAEPVDVLVVGGGPAGAMAALSAAQAGATVLLVDRKRRLGALPHCAEYVPAPLALEVDIEPQCRRQAVKGMTTLLDGEETFTPGPGWILDRQAFDFSLAAQAAAAGARIWANTRFQALQNGRYLLRRGRERVEVLAGAVVAADGAASALAKALGLTRPRLMAAQNLEVPLARPLQSSQVFLDTRYQGGYAWLFPKGKTANLGLGCLSPGRCRTLLHDLRAALMAQGAIGPGVLAVGGGALVLSGPRPQPYEDNLLLAGDAAGLGHAITGAGIPQAVFSGVEAGRAAAALAGGRAEAGQDYAQALSLRYGRYLAKGLSRRQEMEAGWHSGDFAGLMRRVWPAWGGRG